MEIEALNIYKGKRVFVTGHTGFKGSWLVQLLESLGAEVMGYSLPPTTNPNHFSLVKGKSVGVLEDILDAEKLGKCIRSFDPDIVFHLAAQPLVRQSYIDPLGTYNTNVIGTLNLLNSVRTSASVKAVVCITTDKVYENNEWIYPYRESDPLGGYDMYSSSKACCEVLINSFRRSFFHTDKFGKEHCILLASARAGNVIGGGDWSVDRLVPDIVLATSNNEKVLIRNKNSIRPWQHVLDCLYGYLLLGRQLLQGNVFFASSWNFAPYSYESLNVEEVINVAKLTWKDIEVDFRTNETDYHEAKILKLDNSKAISELGWKPVWNTETAIKRTFEWYKEFYISDKLITKDQISEFLTTLNKENE